VRCSSARGRAARGGGGVPNGLWAAAAAAEAALVGDEVMVVVAAVVRDSGDRVVHVVVGPSLDRRRAGEGDA
jgi:hypothetical protein